MRCSSGLVVCSEGEHELETRNTQGWRVVERGHPRCSVPRPAGRLHRHQTGCRNDLKCLRIIAALLQRAGVFRAAQEFTAVRGR